MDGILSFSVRPLRLVGLTGGLVSAVSFSYLLLVAVLRIVRPELAGADFGYASIIGMISLLGGCQLLAIWLLGEYIGRIYEQVKQRPGYLVREPSPSNSAEIDLEKQDKETRSKLWNARRVLDPSTGPAG